MGLFGFLRQLISGKRRGEVSSGPAGDDGLLLEMLQNELAAKGFKPSRRSDLIVLPELGLSIRSAISEKHQHKNAVVIKIDFEISGQALDGFISEALAGAGSKTDLGGAIKDGLKSFMPLFELLAEALGNSGTAYTFETKWGERDLLWHAYLSALSLRGRGPAEKADPTVYFQAVKSQIMAELGNKKYYLIKIFTSRQDEGKTITECLVDGERFPAADAVVDGLTLSWPGHGFGSEKQYILLRQCDRTFAKRYGQADLEKVIPASIELMMDAPEDAGLFGRLLEAAGGDRDLAFELYCLVPNLCCEYLFRAVEYGDDIVIRRADEIEFRIKKTQLYIYNSVKVVLYAYLRRSYQEDKVVRLLSCLSSNFALLNEALERGCCLPDIKCSSQLWLAHDGYDPYR